MARTKNRGNNTANSPTSYKSMRWRLGNISAFPKRTCSVDGTKATA